MLPMESILPARHVSIRAARFLAMLCLGASIAVPQAHAVRARNKPAPRAEAVDGTSLLGSYLAGHVARSSRDSDSAAFYYRRALAKDPNNQEILDDAFQLELAAGEFEAARSLARRLVRREPANSVAHILLGLEAFKRRDYGDADDHFRAAQRNTTPDEPTIKLARAWLAVAQGHADKAIAVLQNESKTAWAKHFETVQRAFMADVAKKKEIAAEAY